MAEGDATLAATEPEPEPASTPGSEAELLPATLVGRYRIDRRLGAGSMGVVYAAHDLHLLRAVAIKVVGPRLDPGSGQDRLVREAQAMAKLRHPNLVTVHDLGISIDRLFVVMELVDGGTLADWLAARPRTWREIVALYVQAARGLAAVHAAGFVHRDFKPENVLVGTDGVARVTDFGVARVLGEAEGPGAVGTPGYIAPEILRRESVDGRADQFSLCVALHAAVYGERPFDGPRGIGETLGSLRTPPRGVAPRWLAPILARGLASDPGERWPSIDALTAAIERRSARRRRARIAMIGIGAAVAAALAIAIGTRSDPVPPADWSPIVIGRERDDARSNMAVSADGSTLVTWSAREAWVEARAGTGDRRNVRYPVPGALATCRLSRRGVELFCSLDAGEAGFEIWAADVATGKAERRVPAAAAPSVKPMFAFDVGPDDSILFSARDLSALWRLDPRGAVTLVVAAESGQQLAHPVWSPDGTRIAVMVRSSEGARIEIRTPSTGAVAVVSHRFCRALQWLSDRSLACAPVSFRRPVIVELQLGADGEPSERVRYQGSEYQMVTGLVASSAGVVLSTTPNDQHLTLVALDAPGPARPVASGGVSDLPAVGWTSSGALIFGASVRGRLRILALGGDGAIATLHTGTVAEVPLAVLGEVIVFGRFPGGESTIPFFEAPVGRRYPDGELFRIERGGSPVALGPTRAFHSLMCAPGRATCMLVERSGGDAIAVDWDPQTGARGSQRARWSLSSFPGTSALSPDAGTLAQVRRFHGQGALSMLDLRTGTRRELRSTPWQTMTYPTWQPDGTLLALAAQGDDSWIVRVRADGTIDKLGALPASADDDEFRVTPDGKTAAILTVPASQTHWWVPRSPD